MRSRLVLRGHRRPRRQLSREVAELTHAAGAAPAGELTKRVLAELADHAYPSSATVAAVVAAHCADDSQRSALAAYLYLCRDLSVDALGKVFGIEPAAARRLVERGTGTAPVTAGDECRGWALVAPRPDRTPGERHAASGHLSLCRKCRNKLRAHTMLEQRVAAAGSVAFGASVTAAVGRAFAGAHAAGSAAGALTAPIVALSTAAALTAGAGTFAITTRGGGSGSGSGSERTPAGTVRPHPGGPPVGVVTTTTDAHATPAADSTPGPADAPAAGPTARPAPSVPGIPPVRKLLPLPGVTAVPLPTASLPPLPLPSVSLSPVAVPTKLPTELPLPLPSVKLPLP